MRALSLGVTSMGMLGCGTGDRIGLFYRRWRRPERANPAMARRANVLHRSTGLAAGRRCTEIAMAEIVDGWEVVSRRAERESLLRVLLGIFITPAADVPPPAAVSTWTVRHTTTGEVHKVTGM